jgi:hypothetical protein
MAQLVSPGKTKIQIVPRDGELEITVNINITVDGQVIATVDDPKVAAQGKKDSQDDRAFFVPDFSSGAKLNFGKMEE